VEVHLSPPCAFTARQYVKRQCEIYEMNYNMTGIVRIMLTLMSVRAITVAVDKQ